MRVQILLAATLLAASPAWAIYKCTGADGRISLQDKPCGGSAKKSESVTPRPGNVDVQTTRSDAAEMCKSWLRNVPAWKDAESVQISDVVRMGFTTIPLHGTSIVVVKYGAFVNAKNSYGGYVGKKPAFCFLNQTETSVLDIQTF